MTMTITILFNLVWIIVAYLVGSVNFAILLTSLSKTKVNIRQVGSKNAGATNVMRVYGWRFGLVVFLCDASKAFWFAVALGLLQQQVAGFEMIIPQLATAFVIVGHVFPLLYDFKGGKGAACLLGMIASISLLLATIGTVLFLLVLFTTRYVSLGSIVVPYGLVLFSLGAPYLNGWVDSVVHYGPYWVSTIMLLLAALFVSATHWSNICRLVNGTENRLQFDFITRQKQKYS